MAAGIGVSFSTGNSEARKVGFGDGAGQNPVTFAAVALMLIQILCMCSRDRFGNPAYNSITCRYPSWKIREVGRCTSALGYECNRPVNTTFLYWLPTCTSHVYI